METIIKHLEKFCIEFLESQQFEVSMMGAKLCKKHWVKHQDFCSKCEEENRSAAGHPLE